MPRPPSLPFVSGDSFRALAHHVYADDAGSFDPGRVEPGDVVFVATRLARGFFAQFHRRIERPYVLITHNCDENVTPELAALHDERILACRHHVIANSSFSWWGAWLGQHPGQIVYTPRRYYRNHDRATPDLYPAAWRLL